jgi:ubiquinol-cytochrome c reductase cytochrome b subunit
VRRRVLDWIDERTGLHAARGVLLDEPLPPGTGWFFTLGSVLLALLAIQTLTGAFLTLYYAPTPDHAYDSVRFIGSTRAGYLVRALHHFGASFIVVAAVLHMLRVIAFGSYKRRRELTWLSGVALLGLILAFALTGYLLPWDQRAYWATVVTINISRLAPVFGNAVAGVLQGGTSIGALTLTRWYSAHVIFLPALLALFVVGHLVLMRRQGISGPVRPREGAPVPFYPHQAARDVTVVSIVLVALFVLAWRGMPAMEGPANPTDATYIPRPEWYFLGLFQLLKYFPGKLEVVGAILLPTLIGALLALLPWLDRGPDRDPRRRAVVMLGVAAGVFGVVLLTTLGWRDRPVTPSAAVWSMRAIGGRQFAEAARCERCHSGTGMADALDQVSLARGPDWVAGHVSDPEMIAPGLREPPTRVTDREGAALVAFVTQLTRSPYPGFPASTERAAAVWARYCVGCHVIDGDGGSDGPELTHIGSKHAANELRKWIADPEAIKPETDMPSFEDRLTPGQLDSIAEYLASRK